MAAYLAYRILMYCYDPGRLYKQLAERTSPIYFPDSTNICTVMFNGADCHGFEEWTDGKTYEGGVKVSFGPNCLKFFGILYQNSYIPFSVCQ